MSELKVQQTYVHGEVDPVNGDAFCHACKSHKHASHFELDEFMESHPFTERGISAKDMRAWSRGYGADGDSPHRCLRWQRWARAHTLAAVLKEVAEEQDAAGIAARSISGSKARLAVVDRPNILDELEKPQRPRPLGGIEGSPHLIGLDGGSR